MRSFLRKNRIIILLLVLICITSYVALKLSKGYYKYFAQLYCDSDFHYNLITFNSVIAGFLFSGLSILISLISNESIKRLWDNGYLDGLYHSGTIGICMNILSIIMSFITVLNVLPVAYQDVIRVWVIFEIIVTGGSLVFFIYCVHELVYSINILKKK